MRSFSVLCFLPMNGAGPSAPEPGDSRGVTTGGTMGSRALGSDIERHEVHGATHGCGSGTTSGPADPAHQHHPLRQTTFGRPNVEPTTTPPRFPPTTPPGRPWGMAMRQPNVDAAEAQPRAPTLNWRLCTDEGDPHADNGAPSWPPPQASSAAPVDHAANPMAQLQQELQQEERDCAKLRQEIHQQQEGLNAQAGCTAQQMRTPTWPLYCSAQVAHAANTLAWCDRNRTSATRIGTRHGTAARLPCLSPCCGRAARSSSW